MYYGLVEVDYMIMVHKNCISPVVDLKHRLSGFLRKHMTMNIFGELP